MITPITLADLDQFNEECRKYRQDNPSRGVPIAFVSSGVFTFRIWPDRNAAGQPRIMKTIFANRLLGKKFYMADDRIQTLVTQAERAGIPDMFKHKKRELGYVMVQMIKADPETKHIKSDMDLCLIVEYEALRAIREFVTELPREQKLTLLDPATPAPPLVLRVSKKDGRRRCHFFLDLNAAAYTMRPMQLPPGVRWKGLDNVYCTENDVVTDELLFEFKKQIGRRIYEAEEEKGRNRNIKEPVPGAAGPIGRMPNLSGSPNSRRE